MSITTTFSNAQKQPFVLELKDINGNVDTSTPIDISFFPTNQAALQFVPTGPTPSRSWDVVGLAPGGVAITFSALGKSDSASVTVTQGDQSSLVVLIGGPPVPK